MSTYNPLVDPIFEIMGTDGSHVRIYADGRCTGYPVNCSIFNGILTLIHAVESVNGRALSLVIKETMNEANPDRAGPFDDGNSTPSKIAFAGLGKDARSQ